MCGRHGTQRGSTLVALLLLVPAAAILLPGVQAADLPDLVILGMSPVERETSHGFVVHVRNNGTGPANASVLEVTKHNTWPPATADVPALAAGAEVEVTVAWHSWLFGAANFTARIDPTGGVDEANDTNNNRTIAVAVPRPDLRVASIVALGDRLVADELVEVRVTFQNHGPGTARQFSYSVTDGNAGWRPGAGVQRLDAGQSITETVAWRVPKTGVSNLTATVDGAHQNEETNETNNVLTVSLNASAPNPLTLQSRYIGVASDNVTGGVRYNVTVVAEARGDHVPWTSLLTLYDGGAAVANKTITHGPWTVFPFRYSNDEYATTLSTTFSHIIADGHEPDYNVSLRLDVGRPWSSAHNVDPDNSGPPVVVIDPIWAMRSTHAGPEGLRVQSHNLSADGTITLLLEIENPYDNAVTVDVFWRNALPFEAPFAVTPGVVVPAHGRTNASVTIEVGGPGLQLFSADVAEAGTNGTGSHFREVLHATIEAPDALHIEMDDIGARRDDRLGGTIYDVPVRAAVDMRAVRLDIVEQNGHRAVSTAFPVDIKAGDTAVFTVQVYDSTEATGPVVVRAVSMGAESAAVELAPAVPQSDALDAPAPAPDRWAFGRVALVSGATVGVGGIVAALLAANEWRRWSWLRRLLEAGIAVGLFSRIHGDKALAHPTREEIHRFVNERPGVHFREVQRSLRLSNGRLVHHLSTLEREGLVRSERDGPRVRFYPIGARTTPGQALTPRQALILSQVKRRPGILQTELAVQLGVSRQAVSEQIRALRDNGLLVTPGAGRTNALYLDGDADRRLTRCAGCSTVYDRGTDLLHSVACPGCGTT